MKSMWQDPTRREVRERISRLTPDRKPAWGGMSAHQMVCHLARSVKMGIGEYEVAPKISPFKLPGLKQFIVYYAPFPKNVPTAPELVVTDTPNTWDADVADLEGALTRLVLRGKGASWPDHPAFGSLSADDWGVLVYRHADHHLRQFGV